MEGEARAYSGRIREDRGSAARGITLTVERQSIQPVVGTMGSLKGKVWRKVMLYQCLFVMESGQCWGMVKVRGMPAVSTCCIRSFLEMD